MLGSNRGRPVIVRTLASDTLAGLAFASAEGNDAALSAGEHCQQVRSLELRWIFPGQMETAVTGWFGQFPASTESREDAYLLDPRLGGLSLKIRGGGSLEVKAYCGSPGILEVAGRARGLMQSWQKWSFPLSLLQAGRGDLAGWRRVRKQRRVHRFALTGGQTGAYASGPSREPGCAVELTEIRAGGQDWWSLGFEATGPADMLCGGLQAAAAVVFAERMPGGVEPSTDHFASYMQWLEGCT
jgi:hypothetical protein